MADTSMVVLDDLIEQEAGIRLGRKVGQGTKATRKGPCPFCGQGTDRFAVFVHEIPMRYYCGIHGNGCGATGDAITFLREYRTMSYHEACTALNVDPGSEYHGPSKRNEVKADQAPSTEWQKTGVDFCKWCKEVLWSEQGKAALDYLHKRGLSDATINHAGLGYNPLNRRDVPTIWGVTHLDIDSIWIPRGIVIPWQIDGNLWKVNIRRGNKDVQASLDWQRNQGIEKPQPKKYLPIVGGSIGVYGVNSISPNVPVVVVEGEFDSLILRQETNRSIPVVATGSTSHARSPRWIQSLAQSSLVLWAFDGDEAGNKAFRDYWRKEIANIILWRPWAHDINEMKLQGLDIQRWLSLGLDIATLPTSREDTLLCSLCPNEVEHFSPDGIPYCSYHFSCSHSVLADKVIA